MSVSTADFMTPGRITTVENRRRSGSWKRAGVIFAITLRIGILSPAVLLHTQAPTQGKNWTPFSKNKRRHGAIFSDAPRLLIGQDRNANRSRSSDQETVCDFFREEEAIFIENHPLVIIALTHNPISFILAPLKRHSCLDDVRWVYSRG